MLPAGFEPTIPASERPQSHALYRAASDIGLYKMYINAVYNTRVHVFPCTVANEPEFEDVQ